MTIVITGATGNVGSKIVSGLVDAGASVRAIVRDRSKARLPEGVEPATADLADLDAVRMAFAGARSLFLLNAVQPDELTQALLALNVARQLGIERIVYLSVFDSHLYTNVPHFAGKRTVEIMLETMGMGATVLRPAYFMDNDLSQRDSLMDAGLYTMPIGPVGLSMIHSDDIASVAVLEILRRDRAEGKLAHETMDLVGPDVITSKSVTDIWSSVLGRNISHAGNDTGRMEEAFRQFAPPWLAYDMSLMAERFQTLGMRARTGDVERLERMLGRKLTTYRGFAELASARWRLS